MAACWSRWSQPAMATTNKVKGWTGVLMTEDSSSHWTIKRRYVYSETSRRAGLEFVCIFGHDGAARKGGPYRESSPISCSSSLWKGQGETDRPRLRSTAPALDPTGLPGPTRGS